jgi:DNA repair protein RecO
VLLLRTESVASSKLEAIEASLDDYARALHGIRANSSAVSMVAATTALGSLIGQVTRRGRIELTDITSAHAAVRERPYTLSVALIGAEAVLKLHPEPDPQPRVFDGLVRFLELLDGPVPETGDPAADALAVGFQLKLLLLAGYLPHLTSCASCGTADPLIGYSPVAGGAVCESCSGGPEGFRLRPGSLETIEQLIERPLRPGRLDAPAAQDAMRVVEATYAFHGGFRMRTLHA